MAAVTVARRAWWRRWWWVVPIGMAIAGAGVWLIDSLWTSAGADRGLRVEAARTTFSVIVGLGGAATLALLVHRQVLQARDQTHREQVAVDAKRDADERRAQELFVKAVEQLGHDRAAVRIGALHALDALGQEHAHRRRAVMDVWCAYLRMPPTTTGAGELVPFGTEHQTKDLRIHAPWVIATLLPEDLRASVVADIATWPADELHVRDTAQRLIAGHLRDKSLEDGEEDLKTEPDGPFWGAMDVDLTGAHLHNLRFSSCRMNRAVFERAQFTGHTRFDRARFAADTDFEAATFNGGLTFDGAGFAATARFWRARFTGFSSFGARFDGQASFSETTFVGSTWFQGATFAGDVGFADARFSGLARFDGGEFAGDASFSNVRFEGRATWRGVKLAGRTSFYETHFAGDAIFEEGRFTGKTSFFGVTFAGLANFENARFLAKEPPSFSSTDFGGPLRLPQMDVDNLWWLRGGRIRLVFGHVLPAGWRAAPADGSPGRALEKVPDVQGASTGTTSNPDQGD